MDSGVIGAIGIIVGCFILMILIVIFLEFTVGTATQTYRIVSRPTENNPDDKYYVIQQYFKHSKKWRDWYGFSGTYGYSRVYFRYKGYELGIDCWRYKKKDDIYCPHFYKAQDADKALKDIIEFKHKIDNVPGEEIVKEITFKQTL